MHILEARENASHHLPKRTRIYQALIMVDIISGAHKRLSATNWLDVQLLVTTNYKLINLDQISTLNECERHPPSAQESALNLQNSMKMELICI